LFVNRLNRKNFVVPDVKRREVFIMATEVKTKSGKTRLLFMPNEKAQLYAGDLRQGVNRFTDQPLTDFQRGQRSGYLNARKDEAKLFKWKQKKGLK
jgi:hypothetical protein